MKTLQTLRTCALLATISAPILAVPSPAHAQLKRKVVFNGIIAGPPVGNEFRLRSNGQLLRVRGLSRATIRKIRGGDQVRVYGVPLGLTISSATVRVVRAAASSQPDDYAESAGTSRR